MPRSTKKIKTASSSFKYRYILALGSNLGDLDANIEKALASLAALGFISRQTRQLTTKPLAYDDGRHIKQGVFRNLLVDFASDQEASDLYQEIVTIEDALGHDRNTKGASRHIDIDILLWFKNQAESLLKCDLSDRPSGSLTIPHPELFHRDFLVELLEHDFNIPVAALKSKLQNAGKA